MTLLQPGFLWLLPLVALLWWFPRRGVARRHGVLRSALFASLVLALARPVVLGSTPEPHHVVIVDRTASVANPQAVDAALGAVAARLPADGVRVLIELGGGQTEGRPATPAAFTRSIEVAGARHSPLGATLELALREIPTGAVGAVTVLSDGLATDPRWGLAIQELTRRGLPLHGVELAAATDDVAVVSVRPLDELRIGQTGRVEVVVTANGADVRVSLTGDDELLAAPAALRVSARETMTFEVEPARSGALRLVARAEVLAGDNRSTDNDAMGRTVAVREPIPLLYLGGRIDGAAAELGRLLGPGFAMQPVPAADAPLDLSRTALVMLDDRTADAVPERWQRQIVDAVQQRGLGLMLSGGRSAFGPGGWHGSPIEAIAPVEAVQKEEKKDPSTALAIVIDTSGSMYGDRMTLAKEIARLAIRRLQPHDKVGIVEFHGTKQWAAPLQSAANVIDLQRALGRLDAGGGTTMMPGIEEAYYALKNADTRHKHLLILTDAGVEPAGYERMLRKVHDDGIAVSAVLVGGGEHDEFLNELAGWGGGRYYHAPDRFNLPELLLKKPSTSPLPAYREGTFAVDASYGPGWWGDVATDAIPPVMSLVETRPRPGAAVLLSVRDSGRAVLTTWRNGLGRVTALGTEPVGPGSSAWRQWPDYGAFLARVLTRTARSLQEPFDLRLRREESRVVLEARRLVRDRSVPNATRAGTAVPLREVAPGVFRGAVTAAIVDEVRLSVTSEHGFERLLISDPLDARVPETQVDPLRALPLAEASLATGGRYVASGTAVAELPTGSAEQPLQVTALWPWLALAALAAFLADVWYRRSGGRIA